MLLEKIHKCGSNWIIEKNINDEKFINDVNMFIDNNKENFICNKKGLSTKGKNSKQYWIHQPPLIKYLNNDNYKCIENYIRAIIYQSIVKNNILEQIENAMGKKYELFHSNSWSVTGEEGGYHLIHSHHENPLCLSSVLYTKVPDKNILSNDEFDNMSGNIFFVMNSLFDNIYNKKSKTIHILPSVGKLLIFPSWLLHGTYPQSKGTRQTLNINYYLAQKNNENSFFYY